MVNVVIPFGLEGLVELDRKGVDIKPTLLRVLTDQYLRNPAPSPEEERCYTELATRLLYEVDISTRASTSALLAPHARAPRSIVLDLARDVLAVAEPVLLHSPVLTPADCNAIIEERGASYAEILARRERPAILVRPPAVTPTIEPVEPEPPTITVKPPAVAIEPTASEAQVETTISPTMAVELAEPEPQTLTAAPAYAAAEPPSAAATPLDPTLTPMAPDLHADDGQPRTRSDMPMREPPWEQPRANAGDEALASELCELFFTAGSAERRLILLNLDFAAWAANLPTHTMQRTDIWRVESAALRHSTTHVMQELEQALGISHRMAQRIVDDDLGEPIVAATKAMNMPADVVQRMLLFMNPRVGLSVDRVYELADLYNEISIDSAKRLVEIMRAAEPAERKRTDARSIHSVVEAARRAVREVSSAQLRRHESRLRQAANDI